MISWKYYCSFRTVKWDPENIIAGKTKNNKEALKEKDLTHLYWKILAVYRACKSILILLKI